jgi:hypothetical protein
LSLERASGKSFRNYAASLKENPPHIQRGDSLLPELSLGTSTKRPRNKFFES